MDEFIAKMKQKFIDQFGEFKMGCFMLNSLTYTKLLNESKIDLSQPVEINDNFANDSIALLSKNQYQNYLNNKI